MNFDISYICFDELIPTLCLLFVIRRKASEGLATCDLRSKFQSLAMNGEN